MEDETLPTPGVSISRRFRGEAWLKYLLYVYAFPKAFVNFRPRAGMGLDGGCVDGFNPPAVDMGQVEGEGAAAEVGAVIVGRVPFAAEVAAVSGDIASVGDGGSGGITRNRHFRAEVGVPQGGEVKGNPPVVSPAANASAGVRFRGGR